MKYRVVQWATGPVGQAAIRAVVANERLEFVGAYVFSEDKAGKDVGEIAGIGPIGIRASNDVESVLALRPDCIVYAPLYPDPGFVCTILERGINVVTPSGFWHPPAHPELRDLVDAACRKGGASIHGSGIHPGFSERLLLTLSAASHSIDHLLVREVSEQWDHPSAGQLFEGTGFGLKPEIWRTDPARRPAIDMMEPAFRESQSLVAAGLGVEIAEFRRRVDLAVAPQDLSVAAGTIRAGTVAGMHWQFEAHARGRAVIRYEAFWMMGRELEPNWGLEGNRYELEVHGDPPLRLTLDLDEHESGDRSAHSRAPQPGIAVTGHHCVSAIAAVCEASPGIASILTLPLVTGVGALRAAGGD